MVAQLLVEVPDEAATPLVEQLRALRPRVVVTHWTAGRHPDHRVTAELVRDACFVSGLAKLAPDTAKHRPLKVVHCMSFRQDFEKPTFVVDITEECDLKLQAVRCYASQFEGATQAGEVYPTGDSLYDVVRFQASYYGSLIRTRFGEPFFTFETMRVDDVAALEVSTF